VIVRPHPLLDHAVDASALLHGIRRRGPSIINITGA
jgi:hypothetical protein